MAKNYRYIRTPGSLRVTFKTERRIKIPQPVDRPVSISTKGVVRWEDINEDPWWMSVHRRGPYRPLIGENLFEARAVSRDQVKGYLHERMVYQALVKIGHLVPGMDFTYQSSQMGGRQELGGLVADFLLPNMKMVIQVDGPTHVEKARQMKDQEQDGILAEMGYTVYHISLQTIESEYELEEWMRRTFNFANGYGGSTAAFGPHDRDDQLEFDDETAEGMLSLATAINNKLFVYGYLTGYAYAY